jgi:hypothetical protein
VKQKSRERKRRWLSLQMKNQMHPRGEEEAKNKVNRSSHQTPECIEKPKGIVMKV